MNIKPSPEFLAAVGEVLNLNPEDVLPAHVFAVVRDAHLNAKVRAVHRAILEDVADDERAANEGP